MKYTKLTWPVSIKLIEGKVNTGGIFRMRGRHTLNNNINNIV